MEGTIQALEAVVKGLPVGTNLSLLQYLAILGDIVKRTNDLLVLGDQFDPKVRKVMRAGRCR